MKLLAFSPVSNIWVHSFLEALVGEAARDGGIEVTHVACGRLINSYCVAMEEAGLDSLHDLEKRDGICASCTKRARRIQEAFEFEPLDMARFFTPADSTWVEAQLAEVTPESWPDLTVDGLPIGRFASYEFLLKYKISGFDIPERLWPAYLDQLRNALRVHTVASRILDVTSPDVAMAYNTLYSMNRVFKAHCERRGIPCYSLQGGLHPGHRSETLTMFRDDAASLNGSRSEAWRAARETPVGAESAALVMDAIRELFEARSAFVYSAKHAALPVQETRKSLGLRSDRRTALVALSSRDEMFAADVVGRFSGPIDGTFTFSTQVDWLRHIIGIAVRRSDLQFIIRVHPREFPNKREGVMSPNVARLSEALERLPDNVIVDWPTDGRGIYDVLQVCDVVLGGWSSVGAEASLLGLPVVVYNTGELLGYPTDLVAVVDEAADYERVVDEAIGRGISLRQIEMAFRWYAFAYQRLSVDLSESIPSRRTWSARRVLQGLYSQTRFPVPLWPILQFERRELRRRATRLGALPVIVDTFQNLRPSVADSTAWPHLEDTSPRTERHVILTCVREIVALLGHQSGDGASLSAHLLRAVNEAEGVAS